MSSKAGVKMTSLENTMLDWKRYAAALAALSAFGLAGCGHSQDAAPTTAAPVPSASEQAARAQAVQEQGKAAAAGRAAAAQTQQNAPK